MGLKPGKTGITYIKLSITDKELLDWYCGLPMRSKNRLIIEAIKAGRGLVGPALEPMQFQLDENSARIADLETHLRMTQVATVAHEDEINSLTQELRDTHSRIDDLEHKLDTLLNGIQEDTTEYDN